MEPTSEHLQIKVSGHVQGVFFRQSTKEKADELQLNGFVQNELDGSVYLEAEGKPENLEQLVKWCRKGPEMAAVTSVEAKQGKLKHFTGFEVRR